jgi:3-mercaptopyruvate sulfurtransferase SseA
MVTVSFGFTCGCTQRPSAPVRAIEAYSLPGAVIICERHQEYAVCNRVTTRLVHDPEVLRRLLAEAGVDEDDTWTVPLTPDGFPD